MTKVGPQVTDHVRLEIPSSLKALAEDIRNGKPIQAPTPSFLCEAADEIIKLRDALVAIRGWREIGSADTPSEKLRVIEDLCDAVLDD